MSFRQSVVSELFLVTATKNFRASGMWKRFTFQLQTFPGEAILLPFYSMQAHLVMSLEAWAL